jgi:hypothetical protein
MSPIINFSVAHIILDEKYREHDADNGQTAKQGLQYFQIVVACPNF